MCNSEFINVILIKNDMNQIKHFTQTLFAIIFLLSANILSAQVAVVSGGSGAPAGTGANGANNAGGDASGLGCGGGGASWWGGTGGSGKFGGGGGGAGGYYSVSSINWSGGDGGQGVAVISYYNGASLVSSLVLASGTSVLVPAGVTSAKVWAIGGGGGGGGSTENDGTSGGSGGAGGVAYVTKTVSEGNTISYSLGAGGSGGNGSLNGTAGGNTSATIAGTTIYGNGGAAGAFNDASNAAGGTFSGGDGGSIGGTGVGRTGDVGGAGGGAIGGTNGTQAGNDGGTGANAIDVSGLFAACSSATNPVVPTLTSFTPNAGLNGTSVIINGSGFTGATNVKFGGIAASSFIVNSSTQITAVVAAGSKTGSVSVTLPYVTLSKPVYFFTVPVAPSVTSFTPTSGSTGAVVTIAGTKLTGATAVSFGGTPASSFTVNSEYQISATIGAGATGTVSVTTPSGTGSLAGFSYLQPQTITFGALSAVTYGATTTILSGTGGASGNPVTFTSSDPTVASCTGTNGTTITYLKAGNCTIYANQAGNGTYAAATQVGQSLTINPKSVTITGVTAATKVYNGINTATLSGGATTTGVGTETLVILAGTGIFADKNVGTKSVTAIGYALANGTNGGLAANYTLSAQPVVADQAITAKPVTITGVTAATKVYDGSNTAALSGGSVSTGVSTETLAIIAGTGTFADKNVETKAVTATGYALADGTNGGIAANYTLSAQPVIADQAITTKPVTITGVTAATKVYNGINTATLSGGATTTGVGTETLAIIAGTGTFADKNVGTKSVTAIGYALANGTNGGLAANYTLSAQPVVADQAITAKTVTITGVTAVTKAYDGSNTAILSGGSVTTGVGTETLAITAGTGTFADKNVGTRAVTATGYTLADGTNGGVVVNYSLSAQPSVANQTITAKILTVNGASVANKVYDGTADASITGATLVGKVSSEDVTLATSTTGTFNNANVGNGKSVTPAMTILGTDIGNYTLTQPTLTANITESPLQITATSGQSKVFGSADPVFTYTITSGSLVTGDVLSGSLSRTAGEAAGNYPIQIGSLSAGGNYNITFISANFVITLATGLESPIINEIHIYPNPTTGILTINANEGELKVINNEGKVIMVISLKDKNIIDISNQPSGFYIFTLTIEGAVKHYKIIKR
jgi:hypothetical protein